MQDIVSIYISLTKHGTTRCSKFDERLLLLCPLTSVTGRQMFKTLSSYRWRVEVGIALFVAARLTVYGKCCRGKCISNIHHDGRYSLGLKSLTDICFAGDLEKWPSKQAETLQLRYGLRRKVCDFVIGSRHTRRSDGPTCAFL